MQFLKCWEAHSEYGGGGGGRGVLRISSDRDDQRICLEIFDSGICLSRKIFASFLGSLIYVEIVLGIQNYLKIYDCYII